MIWELEFGQYLGPDEAPEIRDQILAERPQLPPALDRPWRCWHELEHDRSWISETIGAAMGNLRGISRPSGITWSALALWCQINAVTEEDRPWLIAQVRAMDSVYLQRRNNQITEDIRKFLRG
ncbi:phage tail assembly chaperone [Asaia spathodeae]|uniref:Uncharacterized protein n=1 Tax=Asaia spathodeae TaxID=657016 RepID=A0ABX2P349_9PROT|nr:hypothetical protein [Asaia spathodeae]GBR18585.1 hypothetical protein AA105894_2108 [Asaia spathodeae NBRC 105894]